MKIVCNNSLLDFSQKTYVMGILNTTPDSFSDGGLYYSFNDAIRHALSMVEQGADIIDIGGESTRPGSEPVSLQEEISRTIPVIKELSRLTSIPISIDTYKSEVAQRAIDAGASIVNDISGLAFDKDMASVVARNNVPIIVMHIKGKPKDMQEQPEYESLISELLDYFRERISIALEAGIKEENIIIDPGIGFGKTFKHNLEIINNLSEFKAFQRPIAIGLSRKSFIGAILGNLPPKERLEGTLSATSIAIYNGANIVRVHDVKETVMAAKIVDAIKKESY
ncbi:MAG: dihydropteroate synthase [Thermodesulfovibrionales bacterium]|nr:dihydropteroate synthase [Thermodesulfovibrionales bacterium]